MSAAQLAEAHGVLAAKVRSQAAELTRTLEALAAARAYGSLVERRLLQGAPEHALPVTEAALATPFPRLTLRAPRDDGGEARAAAESAVRRRAAAHRRASAAMWCAAVGVTAHSFHTASSAAPLLPPPRSFPMCAPS